MKIVFVCSSNVCRSPYCELIAKKLVDKSSVLKDAGVKISSAAVFNRSKEIFRMAVKALQKEGFSENEIKAFSPRFKSDESVKRDFEEADVIIGMTNLHRLETPAKYRKKFTTLSQAATGTYIKIPDPFLYKSQERYDEAMAMIKEFVEIYLSELEIEQKTKH